MEIKEILYNGDKANICSEILNLLPNWFGIPEATRDYIESSKGMIFFAAYIDQSPIGFIALNPHNEITIEVHVMGIMQEFHRKGIGRELINKAIEFALKNNYKLLEVKTLDETHPDPYYARTRLFYQSMGFLPLECIKEIWGIENPCLIMVKPLY